MVWAWTGRRFSSFCAQRSCEIATYEVELKGITNPLLSASETYGRNHPQS